MTPCHAGFHDGVEIPRAVTGHLEVQVIVGDLTQHRIYKGVFPRLPGLVGAVVEMKGEITPTVRLIGPHDADTIAAQSDHAGDVIRAGCVALNRQVEGLSPRQVVAETAIDLDPSSLHPGDPELPGGVLL